VFVDIVRRSRMGQHLSHLRLRRICVRWIAGSSHRGGSRLPRGSSRCRKRRIRHRLHTRHCICGNIHIIRVARRCAVCTRKIQPNLVPHHGPPHAIYGKPVLQRHMFHCPCRRTHRRHRREAQTNRTQTHCHPKSLPSQLPRQPPTIVSQTARKRPNSL